MGDISPHHLHALVRAFMGGGGDPYGRTEPQFDVRNPRAQTAGEGAVANALAPDPRAATAGPAAVESQLFGMQGAPYSEAVSNPRAELWGENAVDKALNPPTGSGSGFWQPGEAGDVASAVGQSAVEGALKKRARGKIARGGGEPKPMFAPARTSDPNLPQPPTRSRSPGKSEQEDTPTE